MTNILAIDTSMNACTVAVQAGDTLFFAHEPMSRGQSERLMPMIMDVVGQAGLTLPDIDVYAAANGPGTFTGIRVGLSTIRALAQISGKPVRAISTFDAVADGTNADVIIIETKRSDFYVRLPDGTQTCIEPANIQLDSDWVIAGDANTRLISQTGINNKTIDVMSPTPQSLINCALRASDVQILQPVYLRGADVSTSRQKAATIT